MAFAEVLLGAVAQEMLQKVAALADNNISRLWGFKSDLLNLTNKLTMIQAYLSDAEARQTRDQSVKLWLTSLSRVAHDADSILDELAFEIKKPSKFISSHFSSVAFRFKMSRKVKNISSRLAEVSREASEFGLRPLHCPATATEKRPLERTHPFVDDKEIIGRSEDVSRIVDMLINPDNDKDSSLSLLAIVGMADLGKTSLAQLVYKDTTARRHFDKHIWVCVSDNFNVDRLLRDMLESVSGAYPNNFSNIEPLVQKLRESLAGKKCLFVLDDVWNNDVRKWESMKNAMLAIGASRQSRVLVTTRSGEVASTLQDPLVYSLRVLSEDESWDVFKQHGFRRGVEETPRSVAIARDIVRKCKGLPLAIRAMGGLMSSKNIVEEWVLIRNSKTWHLPGGIIPAPKLSYDNLPLPSLKQCFAFCSIFPQDFVFQKQDLIQMWMAHGFLQPARGTHSHWTMEDKGNDYFNILLRNSLFQDTNVDAYGNVKEAKMHDLVHDLAQIVSKTEVLVLDGITKENTMVDPNNVLLHLSVMNHNKGSDPITDKQCSKKLHTLFLDGTVTSNQLLGFNRLRVLKLQGVHIRELPASISKLKHLRYLNISRTSISELPKFVTKLYNLPTLTISSCESPLPEGVTNLVNLRHLYVGGSEVQLPRGIGRLMSLQTLGCFNVGQEKGRQIEELGFLNELRGALCIQNLQNVRGREEAKRANLVGKDKLWKLNMVWESSDCDDNDDHDHKQSTEVLEALEPHLYLKSLKIDSFRGEKLPSWIPRLENLVKFTLLNCKNCQDLPMLGCLPCLKVLCIGGMRQLRKIGTEFYHNHHKVITATRFPALRELTIKRMPNLVEWAGAAVQGTNVMFPFLEELNIILSQTQDCPKP